MASETFPYCVCGEPTLAGQETCGKPACLDELDGADTAFMVPTFHTGPKPPPFLFVSPEDEDDCAEALAPTESEAPPTVKEDPPPQI